MYNCWNDNLVYFILLVYSCGNNDYGQLGHNESGNIPHIIEYLSEYTIITIACGLNHSIVLTDTGIVIKH